MINDDDGDDDDDNNNNSNNNDIHDGIWEMLVIIQFRIDCKHILNCHSLISP
jgi:hypothetical protein